MRIVSSWPPPEVRRADSEQISRAEPPTEHRTRLGSIHQNNAKITHQQSAARTSVAARAAGHLQHARRRKTSPESSKIDGGQHTEEVENRGGKTERNGEREWQSKQPVSERGWPPGAGVAGLNRRARNGERRGRASAEWRRWRR